MTDERVKYVVTEDNDQFRFFEFNCFDYGKFLEFFNDKDLKKIKEIEDRHIVLCFKDNCEDIRDSGLVELTACEFFTKPEVSEHAGCDDYDKIKSFKIAKIKKLTDEIEGEGYVAKILQDEEEDAPTKCIWIDVEVETKEV